MGLYNYIKKVVGFKDIADSKDIIVELASKNLNPYNKKVVTERTYQQAKVIHNVSENDEIQLYRNYAISFYIVLIGLIYCLMLMYFSGSIMTKFVSFGIGSVMLSYCHRFSLYCYLIKHKKTGQIKEHLCSIKEWLPKI